MRHHPLYATAAAALALFWAAQAGAQSNACYKGTCAGLDTQAVGSNYAQLAAPTLPARLTGVAGGSVDARYIGDTPHGPCAGMTTNLPDHVITLRAAQRAMVLEVDASADTLLLVNGPDGWRCNDNRDGHDPAVSGAWAAGMYRVWVASASASFTPYTLTARLPARGEAVGPPAPRQPPPGQGGAGRPPALDVVSNAPVHGVANLAPGGPRTVLEGRAGGDIDTSTLSDSTGHQCFGRTHAAPDHIVTLTERFNRLELAVEAPIDTTLLVNGPRGWLCNDDGRGQNPVLSGSLPAGTYRVWVGAHGRDTTERYALSLTDLDAPAVAPPPPPRPPPVYSFRGRFEDLDVLFEGTSHDAVHAACTQYVAQSDAMDWVDDVVIFGASHRNSAGYWDGSVLCAIVALNARAEPAQPFGVSGVVEGVPFNVTADVPVEVLLRRYLPTALTDLWIDDVTINGAVSRNTSGYWTVEQTVAMVVSASTPVLPGSYVAEGNVEGTAFRFIGATTADVQRQCVGFVSTLSNASWLDDLVVNGQTRRNRTGYWQPADLCMIVGSLAVQR